jgi:hypothetical protein
MPGQDRTGPQGYGPRTGRSLGPCENGFGRGYGGGCRNGFGRRFASTQVPAVTEVQEKEFLEQELQLIEVDKKGIEKRLKELK